MLKNTRATAICAFDHERFVSLSINEKVRPVGRVVRHIAIRAGGLGFDLRASQIGRSVATVATVLCSSTLCCPGDKPQR